MNEVCLIVKILIVKFTVFQMASPFPDSLEGFGYAFNEEGQLRKIDPTTQLPGNEPFAFNVSEDRSHNQRHYEALGEVLTEHIYQLLETSCGLERLPVPKSSPPEESSFVFASPDALTNPDKLLILIHGSGVVRAGQWARRLIINDCLKTGTQIPAIERARELGYAVLVMNTNDNRRHLLPGSENPETHAATVWRSYVQPAPAKHIAIMAHSYGGVCTVALADMFLADFRARVFAVALTDSVHYFSMHHESDGVLQVLREVGCNWVTSDKPLDTPIISRHHQSADITRVSAGHTEHEMTSHSSHESVFKFIEKRYVMNKCNTDSHGASTCEAEAEGEESCAAPEPASKPEPDASEVMEHDGNEQGSESNKQGPKSNSHNILNYAKKQSPKAGFFSNICNIL